MQDHIADKALQIIREAALTAQKIGESGQFTVEEKSANNPLSEADLAADRILRGLSDLIPGSVYYSEEREDDGMRLSSPWVWIVDPIDGTIEFIEGIPEYAVSVALLCRGEVRFSAVANPYDALFYSVGTEMMEEKLGNYRPDCLAPLCISRSEAKSNLFDELSEQMDLQAVGSIAYKLALVAFGVFEGVISLRPKNEWDVAAGVGLVQASGRVACDLMGRMPVWNQPKKVAGVLAGERNHIMGLLSNHPFLGWFRQKNPRFAL